MGSIAVLAAQARRLNREMGASALPWLYFFTDPARTPDPVVAAAKLPRGAAVVFRHFGAADRTHTARRLSALCRARGLVLLIAADPELCLRVGAHGVHWPERLLSQAAAISGLTTAAVHSARSLAFAESRGIDACVLSPVFPTQSGSARPPLGAFRAGQIARIANLPVIALGGVNTDNARQLFGRGFAGIAAVDAISRS